MISDSFEKVINKYFTEKKKRVSDGSLIWYTFGKVQELEPKLMTHQLDNLFLSLPSRNVITMGQCVLRKLIWILRMKV